MQKTILFIIVFIPFFTIGQPTCWWTDAYNLNYANFNSDIDSIKVQQSTFHDSIHYLKEPSSFMTITKEHNKIYIEVGQTDTGSLQSFVVIFYCDGKQMMLVFPPCKCCDGSSIIYNSIDSIEFNTGCYLIDLKNNSISELIEEKSSKEKMKKKVIRHIITRKYKIINWSEAECDIEFKNL